MWNPTQPGLPLKFEGTEIVKLVPAVRAEIYGAWDDVLQVTPRFDPCVESNVSEISLLALTWVVFTTTLLVPAAMVTNPLMNEPHAAGDDDEKHCPWVNSVAVLVTPKKLFAFNTCKFVVLLDGGLPHLNARWSIIVVWLIGAMDGPQIPLGRLYTLPVVGPEVANACQYIEPAGAAGCVIITHCVAPSRFTAELDGLNFVIPPHPVDGLVVASRKATAYV
jgi:hypothetical protein